MANTKKEIFLNYLKKLKIDFSKTTFLIDQEVHLSCIFDISPKDFLSFAKLDFKGNDVRGRANGLTNAKRAIDCQTDLILTGFKIDSEHLPLALVNFINTNSSKSATKIHLKLFEALGIAPIGILAKVRTLRHKLEHFYKEPTKDEVLDAIELAELFLIATNSKLNKILEYQIKDTSNENDTLHGSLYIRFLTSEARFYIQCFNLDNTIEEIYVDNKDDLFYYLMKIALNTDEIDKIEENMITLLRYLDHPIPSKNIHIEDWR